MNEDVRILVLGGGQGEMGNGGGGTRVGRPPVNYGKLSTMLLSVFFLRGSLSVLTRTLPCP
jgi:hypothetical protein